MSQSFCTLADSLHVLGPTDSGVLPPWGLSKQQQQQELSCLLSCDWSACTYSISIIVIIMITVIIMIIIIIGIVVIIHHCFGKRGGVILL